MSKRRPSHLLVLAAFVAGGCDSISGPSGSVDAGGIELIVNGVLDGEDHPNAGGFFVDRNGNGHVEVVLELGCSGFLIAPQVFLTTGHCLPGAPDGVARLVTFDSEVPLFGDPSVIPVTSVHRHPDYLDCPIGPIGCDLGVLLLAEVPAKVKPARLPGHGVLDGLNAVVEHLDGGADQDWDSLGIDARYLTTVGYGVTLTPSPDSICLTIPPFAGCFYFDGRRRAAPSTFEALDPGTLTLDVRPAIGHGGACFGDSGAPVFLRNTRVAVAAHSRRPTLPRVKD